jgi:Tfp pilus assembly protein PilF
MSRWAIGLLFAGLTAGLAAGQAQDLKPPPVELPPDEDASSKTEQFSFNPVKSKRDVTVGIFYFKKADYKGAADRFRDATKWNDGNADAWLWLGEAEEKRQGLKAAREAYTKYLQLAPDAKNVPEIKKRLARLL